MEIVLEEATKHRASKILRVKIRAGKLMGIVPDLLTFAFKSLSEETIAEGAELEIEEIPFQGKCRNCGFFFSIGDFFGICPQCGSDNLEIEGGNDLELVGLEIERSEN